MKLIWGHAQTTWTAMGGEGGGGGKCSNVHFTNKAHLVKLSTKGEGGQKSPKNGPDGLGMPPYARHYTVRHKGQSYIHTYMKNFLPNILYILAFFANSRIFALFYYFSIF